MILRSKVVVSVFVAAAAAAACQSSDGDPFSGSSGATFGGSAGQAGSEEARAGQAPGGANGAHAGAGAAPGNDGGAGGKPLAQAGSGGLAVQAGSGSGGAAGAVIGGSGGALNGGAAGADDEAGSGGEGGAPDAPGEVAFVGTILGGVFACSVNPHSGAPEPLSDAVAPHGFIAALAVDSSQRFLYIADEQQHINQYPVGPQGVLPPIPSSTITTPDTLNTLTLDPLGRFAYAGSSAGKAIYGYKIDPVTGVLSSIGEPIPVGNAELGGANYVAVDPSGHYLYTSHAFGAGISAFKIDAVSGALDVIAGSPFGAKGVPGEHNVFGGAIVIKPSGDFLYSSGGSLNAFAIDANGKLTLVTGSPFTLDVQSDPDASNLAMDPQGTYLYTTHFLGNNHVSGFRIDPQSGALAAVPGSPLTSTAPYSVAVDPSGRFLYVGVDGPQGLDAYAILRGSGALKQVEGSLFTIGGLEPAIAFATLAR